VIVPYVDLAPETYRAVKDWPGLELYPIDPADVTAYCRLLQQVWAAGETFCVIEHDILPHRTVYYDFVHCPHDYCAFPYPWTTQIGPALGCTRFRAELLAEIPDAMDQVAEMPSVWGPPGHYRQVDVYLMRRVLRNAHGRQPHVHLPPVEHLNPKQQLLASAPRDPILEVRGIA
jgi:hypothetical protein